MIITSNSNLQYATKICTSCKVGKNYSEFHKNKLKKDGHDIYCKSCEKLYYKTNRIKILNRNKLYALENKEKIKSRMKEWRASNLDRIKLERKTFYQKNKKSLKLGRLRPKSRYSYLKTVAKRRNIPVSLTLEHYEIIISKNCFYCNSNIKTESGCGLDRLDSSLGYEILNVVPCCKVCNCIKSNHSLEYLKNHLATMLAKINEVLK